MVCRSPSHTAASARGRVTANSIYNFVKECHDVFQDNDTPNEYLHAGVKHAIDHGVDSLSDWIHEMVRNAWEGVVTGVWHAVEGVAKGAWHAVELPALVLMGGVVLPALSWMGFGRRP